MERSPSPLTRPPVRTQPWLARRPRQASIWQLALPVADGSTGRLVRARDDLMVEGGYRRRRRDRVQRVVVGRDLAPFHCEAR